MIFGRRSPGRIIELSFLKRVHRKLTIQLGRRMGHGRITPISSALVQSSGYRECDRLTRCIEINWNRLEILLLANTKNQITRSLWHLFREVCNFPAILDNNKMPFPSRATRKCSCINKSENKITRMKTATQPKIHSARIDRIFFQYLAWNQIFPIIVTSCAVNLDRLKLFMGQLSRKD